MNCYGHKCYDKRIAFASYLCMNAEFPSCRHVLAAMGSFAFINQFALRVNLSVAIIEMVNSTYLRELDAAAADVYSNSSSGLSDEHNLRTTHDNNTHTDDDDGNVRSVYRLAYEGYPCEVQNPSYIFHSVSISAPFPPLPFHFVSIPSLPPFSLFSSAVVFGEAL